MEGATSDTTFSTAFSSSAWFVTNQCTWSKDLPLVTSLTFFPAIPSFVAKSFGALTVNRSDPGLIFSFSPIVKGMLLFFQKYTLV
jgi:hypothetical protein